MTPFINVSFSVIIFLNSLMLNARWQDVIWYLTFIHHSLCQNAILSTKTVDKAWYNNMHLRFILFDPLGIRKISWYSVTESAPSAVPTTIPAPDITHTPYPSHTYTHHSCPHSYAYSSSYCRPLSDSYFS